METRNPETSIRLSHTQHLLQENNNGKTTHKERLSNFELLRIIAILLIISFQYVFKSGYSFETINLNSYIIKLFWLFGELGVNLFMLITGYFIINQKMSVEKIIRIVAEIFFYNLINVILKCYFLQAPIRLLDIMFPVIYGRYWFVTAYLIIYLLSPFFNILINHMTKIEFKKLLLVVLLIWCIIPTISGLRINSTEGLMYYSRLIWMSVMYLIGAYIKIYDIKLFDTKRKSFIISVSTFGIMALSILFVYQFKEAFYILGTKEIAYLWTPNNIFMLILSISVFEFFAKLKIKPIKIINILASTTLGVYMIHDGCFNSVLWNNLLETKTKLENPNFIFYIIITTLIIFIIGAIIDLIRKVVEKNTIDKILKLKTWGKIHNKINALFIE